MTQPAIGERIKDTDGREYEFYVNEFQQRWWRCVEDHTKLVPYSDCGDARISTSDKPARRRDPWEESLNICTFPNLWD